MLTALAAQPAARRHGALQLAMLALLAAVHSQQCPPPDAPLTQRLWL